MPEGPFSVDLEFGGRALAGHQADLGSRPDSSTDTLEILEMTSPFRGFQFPVL